MYKHFIISILLLLLLIIPEALLGQVKTFKDTVAVYFEEIKTATHQSESLWNI